MPRGVYARKKVAPKKQVAKKAPSTARRTRKPRGVPVDILTIPKSSLVSSVAVEKTPDTDQTIRTDLTAGAVAAPAGGILSKDDIQYAVFYGDDGVIDWTNMEDCYNSYEAAERAATDAFDDKDNGADPVFIVQIVAIVDRPKVSNVRRASPVF